MKNRNMKQKITIAFGAVVICFLYQLRAVLWNESTSAHSITSSIKITTKRSYV